MKNIRWDILLLSVLFMLPRKQQTSDCSLDCTTETKSIYFGSPLVNISCLNNSILCLEKTILYKYILKTALCTLPRLKKIPECPTKNGLVQCSTQECSEKKTICFANAKFDVLGSRVIVNLTITYKKINYAIMFFNSDNICVLGIVNDCSNCLKINEGILSMIKSCEKYRVICRRGSYLTSRKLKTHTKYMVLLIGLSIDNKSAGLVKIGHVETKCDIEYIKNVKMKSSYFTIIVSWEREKFIKKANNCKLDNITVEYYIFDDKTKKTKVSFSSPISPIFIEKLTQCKFYSVQVFSINKDTKSKGNYQTVFTSSKYIKVKLHSIDDHVPDNVTIKLKSFHDPYCLKETSMGIWFEVYDTYSHSSKFYKVQNNIITNVALKWSVLYIFYITYFLTKNNTSISPPIYLQRYYSSLKQPTLFTYGPILEDFELIKFDWAIYRKFEGSIFIYIVQFWSNNICLGVHIMKCNDCYCFRSIYNQFPKLKNYINVKLKCENVNKTYFGRRQVEFKSYIQINEGEKVMKRHHILKLYGISPGGFFKITETNQLTTKYSQGISIYVMVTLLIMVFFLMSIMILLYFFLKKKRQIKRSEAVQVIQRHKRQSDDDTDTKSTAKPSSSEH